MNKLPRQANAHTSGGTKPLLVTKMLMLIIFMPLCIPVLSLSASGGNNLSLFSASRL